LKHKLSDYTSGDLDAAARSPHISDAAKKETTKIPPYHPGDEAGATLRNLGNSFGRT